MTRKLPWEINKTPPAKLQRVPQTPRPKPDRASSPDAEERTVGEEAPHERGRQQQKTPKAGPGWKSPSPPPPRAPPSSFELMREGYDGDDIYVMVEDEFQTIAQSYTAHLHHAEYMRLVKEAREAAPKSLPEPTSPMSKEAKNRLRWLAVQKKQKDTLEQVIGQTFTEADEGELDLEEDKVVDLWSGTSLAPLMASGGQQKTSLIGLERMSSKTKAGMGFTRHQSHGRPVNDAIDEKEDEDGLDVARHSRQASPRRLESVAGGHRSTSHVVSKEIATVQRNPSGNRRSGETSQEITSTPPSGLHSSHSIPEDGGHESRLRKPRPAPRSNRNGLLKPKSEKEDTKSRLEEVPMFLF